MQTPPCIYHPCMREEVESESKMRPLIAIDQANKQQVREKSPSQTEGEARPHSHSHSHSHHPSRPPRPILFLLFPAIVLAIATTTDGVFGLKSRDFGDFNAGFNVFNNEINNEFELENSGLSNDEYGPLCHHTSDITSPPNDTGFNLCPTGVGLREFHDLGYIFAVVFNEYEFNNDLNNIFNEYLNENFYDNEFSDKVVELLEKNKDTSNNFYIHGSFQGPSKHMDDDTFSISLYKYKKILCIHGHVCVYLQLG